MLVSVYIIRFWITRLYKRPIQDKCEAIAISFYWHLKKPLE